MTSIVRYPIDVLSSYHYFSHDADRMIRHHDAGTMRFIGDSGAFSAHQLGTTINIDEYATWCHYLRGRLHWCASLDVIGDPQALDIWFGEDSARVRTALEHIEQILAKHSIPPIPQAPSDEGELGWNSDGTRRLTGRPPIDEFVVALQDAEDCWYQPIELMRGIEVEGDWSEGYAAGRLVFADGTRFEQGGATRLVWACTHLPDAQM